MDNISTEEYPAVYSDVSGRIETILHNDGRSLRIQLRNVWFEGGPHGLGPVPDTKPELLAPFRLANGELVDYSLEWVMPIRVRFVTENRCASLAIRVEVGPSVMNWAGTGEHASSLSTTVRLKLPGMPVSAAAGEDFEAAMTALIRSLAPGWRIISCFTCGLSDYSPGGNDTWGTMECWRRYKDDYRKVHGKSDYLGLISEGNRSEAAQETGYCVEWEEPRPRAGYAKCWEALEAQVRLVSAEEHGLEIATAIANGDCRLAVFEALARTLWIGASADATPLTVADKSGVLKLEAAYYKPTAYSTLCAGYVVRTGSGAFMFDPYSDMIPGTTAMVSEAERALADVCVHDGLTWQPFDATQSPRRNTQSGEKKP